MMRGRLIATVTVLICGVGCAAPTSFDLRRLLPDEASLDGWALIEGPVEYGPDELYDYLDGGAERYLSYGFRRLVHVRYGRAGDDRSGITLDLYDMGSDLGAFGIYSMARRPDSRPKDWGAEGWQEGDVAHAWQGRTYLHGLADDPEPATTAMLARLMERAAERLPGEPSPPTVLDPLPVAGRVPRTERYVATDLLGFGFLGGGVLAGYRIDGREATLIYSDLGSDGAADEAVTMLRAHWLERAPVEDIPSPGRGGFRSTDPELGSAAVVADGAFVAAVQCDPPGLSVDAEQRLLADLVAGLTGAAR
jgi:hypothetical protein